MFPISTLTDMDFISQNIEITMILISLPISSSYYCQPIFNCCFQSLLLESLFVVAACLFLCLY